MKDIIPSNVREMRGQNVNLMKKDSTFNLLDKSMFWINILYRLEPGTYKHPRMNTIARKKFRIPTPDQFTIASEKEMGGIAIVKIINKIRTSLIMFSLKNLK